MDIYDKHVFGNGNVNLFESGRDVYYSCKGLYYLGVNKIDSAEYFFAKPWISQQVLAIRKLPAAAWLIYTEGLTWLIRR